MAQFVTADELANHLRTTFDAVEYTQADQLLTLISGEVDRYCNRVDFVRTAGDTVSLVGTDDVDLPLPDGPVESVSQVDIISGTATTTVTDYTLVAGEIDAVLVRETAGRSHLGGHWGGRLATVEVTYTHGFDGAPDDVKMVVLRAAAVAWANPAGVASEQIDDYSVQYSGRSDGGMVPRGLLDTLGHYRTTSRSVQLT